MANEGVRWTQNEMKTVVLNVAGPHQRHAVAAFPVGKPPEGLRMHMALVLGSRAREERWGRRTCREDTGQDTGSTPSVA